MFMNLADMVEENGKTVRENNEALKHNIPLLTLVEVESDDPDRNGLRLFVVEHSRDCDGTPLYSLSFDKNSVIERDKMERNIADSTPGTMDHSIYVTYYHRYSGAILSGYPESSLTII